MRDWLEVLYYSLINNPQAGMVGLNYYNGLTAAQDMLQRHIKPEVDYVESRLTDGSGTLLSSHGPIFAFRRDVYDTIGGFDQRYFVFYEELDFGVSCRRAGYINYMASYPIVYHMGGATNSDINNLNAPQHLVESRSKFKNKWNLTLDQLREEFFNKYISEQKDIFVRQWNTQLKVWRD